MKISDKGLSLIKKYEGYRSNAYLCSAGKWTIGWGNTFYADGSPVKEGDFIYTRDADKLLHNILAKFEEQVNDLVKVELMQYQFDALVSFVYNVGVGNFKNSTLLRKLNQDPCDPTIVNEFLRWNKANGVVLKGLKRRRNEEAYLFNNEEPFK